jgi:plastocyanin
MAKRKSFNSEGKMKKVSFISAALILVIAVLAVAAVYMSISPAPVNSPILTTTTQPGAAQTTTTQSTEVAQRKINQGANQPTTTVSIPPQTSFVTLEIKNWGFNPDVITISKGSTARWTNLDSKVHTVTSSGNFDSGNIAAGGKWTYTFNKVGTFHYYDKHDSSMTAMVVITE